jgi:hypothetical protein
MKVYWWSGGIAPRILDLGTRWRWVVSFTSRPLYHKGKNPWYPLDRRLGGPQSRSGRGGEEKNSQPLAGIKPYNPDSPARSPALYRLIPPLNHRGMSPFFQDNRFMFLQSDPTYSWGIIFSFLRNPCMKSIKYTHCGKVGANRLSVRLHISSLARIWREILRANTQHKI